MRSARRGLAADETKRVSVERVLDWVVGLMTWIGAPGVGVATAVETVFPPIPSEVVLPMAGFTAHQGHYSVWAAVAWATAGSVLGAMILYYLGAAWGPRRLVAIADRMPLVNGSDVTRAMDWFNRHGRGAIFFGRLIPGIRSVISIPAGVDRMPILQFLGYTTAGSLVWNGLLIFMGYELGAQWHLVERYIDQASTVVKLLVGTALVVFVARRIRHTLAERSAQRKADALSTNDSQPVESAHELSRAQA